MNVDPIALHALATMCQSWSAELAATSNPGTLATPSQATAAAVASVHADLGLASATFSARMESTATVLVDSSDTFSANEDTSSSRLSNLTVNL